MRAAVAAASALVTACGGSSGLGPGRTPDVLPLRAGRQLVTFSGVAVSTDPRLPPCAPIGLPRDGTSVDSFVTLSNSGHEWVARSTSAAEGTIELRLRSAGRTTAGYLVEGSVSGTAINAGLHAAARDVRVTLTAATLEGATSSPLSAFVGGRAAGTIRFTDSAGDGSTCTAIQWTMQPF